MKRISLISLILAFAVVLSAQTKVQPKQVNIIIYDASPETITFFATAEQSVFIISTGVIVVKTVVYLNGLRQTDLKKPSTNVADYALSADKKTVTFHRPLELEEVVIIDYWLR